MKYYRYYFLILTLSLLNVAKVNAQTPCTNGFAGGYPCDKVTLMAHVNVNDLLAEQLGDTWINDLWGWTDPETGKEYALVGMTNGTSFVDVSDPLNPVVVGMLPEHNAPVTTTSINRLVHDGAKSTWRDIKTYQNHAFIISEDEGHGMQVFDLTQLRNVIKTPATFEETAHYDGIGNAHNIVINEATGYAYAVGADGVGYACSAGGLHMINIQDPVNPVYAGCFDADGYTHDAQSVIYHGPDEEYQGKEINFNANENTITIVDVTEKDAPALISKKSYTKNRYAHQGWLTEDHRFFISNDELDEYYNFVPKTRSIIWDVQDLENPQVIGYYEGESSSIDHNVYIKNALAYESNYTSGLRILNIANIENAELKEVAYFDTHPQSNATQFHGNWSNYPFFESGIVIASDMQNGLFILRPELEVIGVEASNSITCEGGNSQFEVYPNSFDYELQWQIKEGADFRDLTEDSVYHNVNSRKLTITGITEVMNKDTLRLKLTEPETLTEYFSKEVTINVDALPEAGFEYTILEEGVAQFTNLSTHATSYRWDFGDGTTSEEENPTHEFVPNSYNFDVILEAVNDCGADSTAIHLEPFETEDEGEEKEDEEGEEEDQEEEEEQVLSLEEAPLNNLNIYPNPSEGSVIVNVPSSDGSITAIRLYTLSGQQLIHFKLNHSNTKHELAINKIAKGVYLLKVETNKSSYIKRVILK